MTGGGYNDISGVKPPFYDPKCVISSIFIPYTMLSTEYANICQQYDVGLPRNGIYGRKNLKKKLNLDREHYDKPEIFEAL